MGRFFGITAIVIGVLSIPPSLVSSVGVVGAVLSIILAGIAAALKEFRYSVTTVAITTVNIFGFSVFTLTSQSDNHGAFIFFSIPYLIFVIGIAIGITRNRGNASTHSGGENAEN